MRTHALLLPLLAIVVGATGCQHDDLCTDAEAQRLGDACGEGGAFAQFGPQDTLGASAFGRMRLGTEWAVGVPVRLDPSPGKAGEANADIVKTLPASMLTDATGFYRFGAAPTFYDLGARVGSEVVLLRGLSARFLEPTIGDDAAPRAFSTHLDVTLDPVPAPDHDVKYFVSGDDVALGGGDLASGADVSFRRFGMTLRVHAVEMAKDDPTKMTAYGFVDVDVQSGRTDQIHIHLAPTPPAVDVSLLAKAPSGTEIGSFEIVMDLGKRRSELSVVRALDGAHVALVPIPGARWWAVLRGKIGEAVTDSGRVPFDPTTGNVTVELVDAPVLEDAAPGVLSASAKATNPDASALREHVLTPLSGTGTTYRIATIDRVARLPDATTLGGLDAAPPHGTYVWTVRAWPDLVSVDALTGQDARVVPRTATSAPRTIVIP